MTLIEKKIRLHMLYIMHIYYFILKQIFILSHLHGNSHLTVFRNYALLFTVLCFSFPTLNTGKWTSFLFFFFFLPPLSCEESFLPLGERFFFLLCVVYLQVCRHTIVKYTRVHPPTPLTIVLSTANHNRLWSNSEITT